VVRNKGCTISQPIVAAYALCICISSQAERILLAGFDGFPSGDPRNSEMDEFFRDVQMIKPDLELISVTPTDYSIVQRSIYEPDL
jgi:4-hydroxy 2-oxovalerate aldolase